MFNIDNEKVEANKIKIINEIKDNPIILNFLKENDLDISCLDRYYMKFKQYLDNLSVCQGCTSLCECRQQEKGYLDKLEFYRGLLQFKSVVCKYKQKENKKYAHKANILVNDMSNEQMLYSSDKSKFRDDMDENDRKKYEYLLNSGKELEEKGFLLYGAPGVGKTYAACCIVNEASKRGVKCCFVNMPSFISRLKLTFDDPQSGYKNEIYALKTAELVVFDDIGSEQISQWSRDEILLPILNYRVENNKLTYFTSNYDLDGLFTRYNMMDTRKANKSSSLNVAGNRITDRIIALADLTTINGKSQRY